MPVNCSKNCGRRALLKPESSPPKSKKGTKRGAPVSPASSPTNSPPNKVLRSQQAPSKPTPEDALRATTKLRSSPRNGNNSSPVSSTRRNKVSDTSDSPSTRRTRSSQSSPVTASSVNSSPVVNVPKVSPAQKNSKPVTPTGNIRNTPKSGKKQSNSPSTPKTGKTKDDSTSNVSQRSRSSSRQNTPSPSNCNDSSASKANKSKNVKVDSNFTGTKRSRMTSSEDESPTPKHKGAAKKLAKKKLKKLKTAPEKNAVNSGDVNHDIEKASKNSSLLDDSKGENDQVVNRGRRRRGVTTSKVSPKGKDTSNSASDDSTHVNGSNISVVSDNIDDIIRKDNKKLVPLITALDSKSQMERAENGLEQKALNSSTSPHKSPRRSSKRRLSNGATSEESSPDKLKQTKKIKSAIINGSEVNQQLKTEQLAELSVAASNREEVVNGAATDSHHKPSSSDTPSKVNKFNCVKPLPSSKTQTSKQQLMKFSESDLISDAESFLFRFGLNEAQTQEVYSCLSSEAKESHVSEHTRTSEVVWCLLKDSSTFKQISFPRCNKLVRQLLDHYCSLESPSTKDKIDLFESCVSWAQDKRRTALSHELQVSLMMFYAAIGQWRLAETTASALYKTIKPLQDKEKIVKACLCLSRCFHALGNLSKARGFITTAKTEALKIYTPPDLQAQLDLQSGILQVAEGKDMETAVSYFREAAAGSPIAKERSKALKYLVLGYLLLDKPAEAHKTTLASVHVADIDEGVEALLAVADSAATASVHKFRAAREKYKAHLEEDLVIKPVLDQLYTDMMEKNIRNIIRPYQRVQIKHVAEVIELPRDEVERRLSQMILDGALSGQLDHRDHCLYLYPQEGTDPVYQSTIKTIAHLEKTIGHLTKRAKKLLL